MPHESIIDSSSLQMYRTWECLRAKRAGLVLLEFPPSNSGVAFGYMNCVVVTRKMIATEEGRSLVKRLLQAAARGADFARSSPREAASQLAEMAQSGRVSSECGLKDEALVQESIEMLVSLHALLPQSGSWGEQDMLRWAMFVAWAFGPVTVQALGKLPNGPDSLNLNALYTNEFVAEEQEEGESLRKKSRTED